MEIRIKVRSRFLDIWKPRPPKDGKGEPKFGGTFLVDPKDKATVKLIDDTIKKVAKEKWKEKGERILKTLDGDKQKFFWFKEDMVDDEGEPIDGTEDMYFFRATSAMQPGIFDRDRTELTRADGKPYPGCVCVVKIDIWPQDNIHGKGIRCQLMGVQFFEDGDPFGGGRKAKADDFEDLSDVGDDDDDDEDARPKKGAAKSKPKRPPVEDDDDDDIA